jgi:hypothetical protein
MQPLVLHRAPAESNPNREGAPSRSWEAAAMQSFIVGVGFRAANRRFFWRAAVLAAAALGLVHAPASAASCGSRADTEAVGKAAVADVIRLFHMPAQPIDLFSVQVAVTYAQAVVSPPGGMVSLYYAKRSGRWKRVAAGAVPPAARKALFPGGDFAACKNPHFLNRGASG